MKNTMKTMYMETRLIAISRTEHRSFYNFVERFDWKNQISFAYISIVTLRCNYRATRYLRFDVKIGNLKPFL